MDIYGFSFPRCDPKVEAFSVERAQSCDFVLMAVSGTLPAVGFCLGSRGNKRYSI